MRVINLRQVVPDEPRSLLTTDLTDDHGTIGETTRPAGACLQAIRKFRHALIACKPAPTSILRFAFLACAWFGSVLYAAEAGPEICIVVGAPGENDYAKAFADDAKAWEEAAARAGATSTVIGLDEKNLRGDRERIQQWIAAHAGASPASAWLVYLGHGTYDGREARLNLRGGDVTAKELARWLAPVKRPLVFAHGGSAAAPFIPALSAPGRIIVTATRSGHELNYARFGDRFAKAIANPTADIDQDGQTSLLEAFVTAAQQTQAFYQETGRLATEHALIDDNGDKQGTPAEWFHGLRLQKRPEGTARPDGDRARLIALVTNATERALTDAQRAQRDALEREVEALRAQKSNLPENEYYAKLEVLFRRLGAIYQPDT